MASRQSRPEKIDLRSAPEPNETLCDRRTFRLSAEQWTAFMAALDAPPRELPRLRRLLHEPSVFELPEPT